MRAHVAARLVVLAATTASVVVGLGGAQPRGVAAPMTVVRTVAVPAEALLPSARSAGVALTADDRLAAATDSRTARADVCSPIWFTALGAIWDQHTGEPLEVSLATSRDGRAFGRPRALDAESGPDPGSPEYAAGESASQLLWSGGGRCARIALSLPAGASVSDVRIAFINSSGTASGTGVRSPSQDDASADEAVLSPTPANAATRQPRLISRERWGANPRLMNCKPDVAKQLRMGFVHHTAGTNRYPRGKSDDIVRAIYAYHTRGRRWCDIAYNFLIDRFGRAFEGRSGGITTPIVGAATQGFNEGSFSVALMGTFGRHRPRAAIMRTLRRLLAWRLDVAHVPPHSRARMVSAGGDNTRYRRGRAVRLPVISPHRATGYTECPGKRVVRRLPRLRDAVAKTGLPKIYRPTISPDGVRLGGARDPVIEARATHELVWTVAVRERGGAPIASFRDRIDDRLRIVWSDGGSHPHPFAPGKYEVIIQGERPRGGKRARGASIPFTVKDR